MQKVCAALFLVASVYGNTDTLADHEERLSALEIQSRRGTLGAHLPSARKESENHFLFDFDIIYWQPKTDFTENGVAFNTTDNALTIYENGHTDYMGFSLEFGIKVGAGYHFAHNNWDLFAEYTNITFKGSYKVFPPGTQWKMQSNFGSTLANTGNVLNMRLSQRIDYETLTLTLSRGFFVTKDLALTLVYGAKASWINQYPNIIELVDINLFFTGKGDAHSILTEKTRGLGPMGIFKTNWYLSDNWSFFGNSGFALLFTAYEGKVVSKGTIISNIFQSSSIVGNSEKKHYVTPNLFLNLGLAYEHIFKTSENYMQLHIGYESQYYIHQSYLMQDPNFVQRGEIPQGAWFGRNLAVYGMTAGAIFQF